MRRLALHGVSLLALLAAGPNWAKADALTLKRVVLSSGGVGQFEYEANVDGQAGLSMKVPLDQVDDVLKSLRIADPAGLPVSVSLPGRQPLAETFRTLPFSADALASPEALLAALVGAEVHLPATGASGTILSVSAFTATLPNSDATTIERHRLSVLTATGIDTAVLEDTAQVEITSSALRQQIAGALAALAANHAQDSRTLAIALGKGGPRRVALSTVIPVPVWKTSYRAVVPGLKGDSQAATGHIEAWAVVENLSGQTWQDVDVTLTSGEPVLYHQKLYDPLFAERPEAPVEVANRLVPQVDAGAVSADATREPTGDATVALVAPPPAPAMAGFRRGHSLGGKMAAAQSEDKQSGDDESAPADASQASTQVLFHLAAKISATPGQSLLLPLLSQDMPIRRIALYQRQTDPTHPLVALELDNNTQAALPPGLVTLYEQGGDGLSYIGDARLPSVQAGETRLASFALDLPVHVDAEDSQDSVTVDVHASRGTLEFVQRQHQTTLYRVAVPADAGRHFVVEIPRQPDWSLVEPDPKTASLTPTDWRVSQDLPAGKTTTFRTVLEHKETDAIALGNATEDQLLSYASQGGIPDKVRDTLRHAAALLAALDKLRQAQDDNAKQQQGIVTDQDRVRKNLGAVPANSDLQRNYLQQLQTQETTLASLRTQADDLRKQTDAAAGAYRDYIGSLSF